MKKTLTLILTAMLILTLAACGSKPTNVPSKDDVKTETDVKDNQETELETEEKKPDKAHTDEKKEPSAEEKKDNDKDVASNKPVTSKPSQSKPSESKPTESKPEESKPSESKPSESKPTESKPEESKPAENKPAEEIPEKKPSTLGNILLADFKAKASSGKTVLEIADELVSNEAILFAGGTMEVEPGLLSGFVNNEITGFKSAARFGPIIGSIPFVGYVFELEDAASVPSFISELKSSANLRWNICVEADEMVTGSVGNKVFFVMCPTSLED